MSLCVDLYRCYLETRKKINYSIPSSIPFQGILNLSSVLRKKKKKTTTTTTTVKMKLMKLRSDLITTKDIEGKCY